MNDQTDTQVAVQAAIGTVLAVAECIRGRGRPVPAGELYAQLMGHLSLETFERILGILVEQKFVERSNHLLTWIGPEKT